MSFGTALATGRTIEDVEEWPERIGAVTVEQVNAAATRRARPDQPRHRPAAAGPRAGSRSRSAANRSQPRHPAPPPSPEPRE